MADCPYRHEIPEGYYVEAFLPEEKCAAVVRWRDGKLMLWIDGILCEMLPDAMPPKEIVYNLSHLIKNERLDGIDAIKQIVSATGAYRKA